MSEAAIYILCMCALVSLGGFAVHLKLDGKSTRFALGIILLSSMIVPISNLISGIGSVDLSFGAEAPEQSEEYEEYMEEAYRLGIERAIADKFSVDAADFSVKIEDFNIEKMSCGFCLVTLYSSASFIDYHAVEKFCVGCGAQKCEVKISL